MKHLLKFALFITLALTLSSCQQQEECKPLSQTLYGLEGETKAMLEIKQGGIIDSNYFYVTEIVDNFTITYYGENPIDGMNKLELVSVRLSNQIQHEDVFTGSLLLETTCNNGIITLAILGGRTYKK